MIRHRQQNKIEKEWKDQVSQQIDHIQETLPSSIRIAVRPQSSNSEHDRQKAIEEMQACILLKQKQRQDAEFMTLKKKERAKRLEIAVAKADESFILRGLCQIRTIFSSWRMIALENRQRLLQFERVCNWKRYHQTWTFWRATLIKLRFKRYKILKTLIFKER